MHTQLPSVGQDSNAYHPNGADVARRIISQEGARHTCVVYFTKADGSARRMVCRYDGATSKALHLITVWDLEKGAYRTINLRTVHTIKVLGARKVQTSPAPDREAARRRVEELKAEFAQMF